MTLRDTLSMGKNEVIINYASQSNNDNELIWSYWSLGLMGINLFVIFSNPS
jgi:hypothetical protein